MPTIQDTLREEARDYQELAAMYYTAMQLLAGIYTCTRRPSAVWG